MSGGDLDSVVAQLASYLDGAQKDGQGGADQQELIDRIAAQITNMVDDDDGAFSDEDQRRSSSAAHDAAGPQGR